MNDQFSLTILERTLEEKIKEINGLKTMLITEIETVNNNSKAKKVLINNAHKLAHTIKDMKQVIGRFQREVAKFPGLVIQQMGSFLVKFQEKITKQQNIYAAQIEKLKKQIDMKGQHNYILERKIEELEEKLHQQNVKRQNFHPVSINNSFNQSQITENNSGYRLNTIKQDEGEGFGFLSQSIIDAQKSKFKYKRSGESEKTLKTEPDEADKSVVSQRSISCRKLDSRSRIRSYIQNFRNIIEVAQSSKQVKPFDSITVQIDDKSQVISRKLSQNHANTPQFLSQTPTKTYPKKKYSFQQREVDLQSQIVQLGGGSRKLLHHPKIPRKDSKQKIQVTQKQKVKSELAAKDCNVVLPRPPSKEKIKMTLKANDVRQTSMNLSKVSRTSLQITSHPIVQEELSKMDIYLGDRKTEQSYEGQKKNDIRWGKGRLQYINGFVYQGDFKDGMRHGNGILKLNGKKIYEGEWQRDRLCGKGILSHIQLINKRRLGDESILRDAVFQGYFDNNKFQGEGILALQKGDRVFGQYNNGLLKGEYSYTNLATGKKQTGIF